MSKSWYYFMGDGDPMDTSLYHKITVKHICLCGDTVCAIYAKGIETRPEPFSPNIRLYITKAIETGQLQPDSPYSAKKYVYLR